MMSLRFPLLACIAILAAAHADAQAPAGGPPQPVTPAAAATAPSDPNAPGEDLSDSELGRSGVLGDEQTLYEERYGYGELPDRRSPREVRDRSYWSFGFGYRHSFAPRGIIELFSALGPSGVSIPQYQFEIDRRLNRVDLITALYYADYSFVGPFRGNGDTVDETEMIESSLRTFGASVSMLWSSNFSDVVALQYGFDFGLGVFFGDVVRTEAYPSNGGPHTRDGWSPCVGPTSAGTTGSAQSADGFDDLRYPSMNTIGNFCGTPNDTSPAGGYTDPDTQNGEQYGVQARGLFNGGKVPPFSWRLAPRLSLRIKPIRQIIIRLDAGLDFGSGIFLGAGLHYGF